MIMSEQLSSSPEEGAEILELDLTANTLNKCASLGLLDDTSVADQLRSAIALYNDQMTESEILMMVAENPSDVYLPARDNGRRVKLTVSADMRSTFAEIVSKHGLTESEHASRAVAHYFRTRANDPTLKDQISVARARVQISH
jgi:hypothetical protein